MLKFTKKHARLLTLAIAVAMIVATMLAIPASAHQHEEGEVYFIYTVNGETVMTDSLHSVPTCGCSNPQITDYLDENPRHKYTLEGHETPLVKHCANCDWKDYFSAITVGGCNTYCYFPIAPWL